ncbi:ubiquinone biosynthesis protein COQ9, mitochondrial-like isoform X2 [Cimex lectularius]|uniref:Ubiquinone biosynthesis protein n=1 Tax=Cimex lectularius TaxID=79782 RepID=A0A8I6RJ42_CIMLE|nr:ubiquinone biosynthesis protein COQ9, mitochondrial-like isoform X2 [Cimex lectularius]
MMARNIVFVISRWPVTYKRNICGVSKRLLTTEPPAGSAKLNDKRSEDSVKAQILDSSLQFVHFHGWSRNAITAGAESLGYPGVTHGFFPKGGIELVEHFYKTSNSLLFESLDLKYAELPKEKKTATRELMAEAVEERLRMIIPYIDKWPEALALMSLPQNIPTALANLLTLVDDICYYAGDHSIDMIWYGKRVALAGIYKATELYMLQDSSLDYKNTWEFLDRRLEEASQLNRYIKQTEQASQFAKDFASATFITARNILGLNWNR